MERKQKKGHLLHKLIHKSLSVDRGRERVLGFKELTALQRERERERERESFRVLGIDRVAQRERVIGF